MAQTSSGITEELLKMAMAATREKAAVVPPAGDPAAMAGAPMDPAAMGGAPMDPSMGGAPMDPAAMGGAPADPAAAGGAPMDPAMAAGDPNAAMQAMVQAEVQKAMGAGGGAAAGAAGPGKAGKPDVAVELQKMNENLYKVGVAVTILFNHLGIEIPPAMMFGQPPATLDPALQAMAAQPGADPAAAAGAAPPADPAAGAPKQASERDPEAAEAEGELDALFAGTAPVGGGARFADALAAAEPDVPKEASAPEEVGWAWGGPPAPTRDASPLSLAAQIRRRARGA